MLGRTALANTCAWGMKRFIFLKEDCRQTEYHYEMGTARQRRHKNMSEVGWADVFYRYALAVLWLEYGKAMTMTTPLKLQHPMDVVWFLWAGCIGIDIINILYECGETVQRRLSHVTIKASKYAFDSETCFKVLIIDLIVDTFSHMHMRLRGQQLTSLTDERLQGVFI